MRLLLSILCIAGIFFNTIDTLPSMLMVIVFGNGLQMLHYSKGYWEGYEDATKDLIAIKKGQNEFS